MIINYCKLNTYAHTHIHTYSNAKKNNTINSQSWQTRIEKKVCKNVGKVLAPLRDKHIYTCMLFDIMWTFFTSHFMQVIDRFVVFGRVDLIFSFCSWATFLLDTIVFQCLHDIIWNMVTKSRLSFHFLFSSHYLCILFLKLVRRVTLSTFNLFFSSMIRFDSNSQEYYKKFCIFLSLQRSSLIPNSIWNGMFAIWKLL